MASAVVSNTSTANGTVTVPPDTMPAVLGPVGTTVAILFLLFGVFGNVVTIIVSWKLNKQKKQWTHALVISVAVVDLAFSLFQMPLNIDTYIHLGWNTSTVLCRIHAYVPSIAITIQATHTAYIIFLKHLIVVHNIKNIPEGKTNYLVIVLLWALPALFVLFGVFCLEQNNIVYVPKMLRCTVKLCRHSKIGMGALVMLLVTITYSQGRIYWYVKKSHNSIQDCNVAPTVNNINRIHRQKEATLAKTFTITFLAVLTAYTPMTILKAVDTEMEQPPALYFFCTAMFWTAAFVNPTVYFLTNKKFRGTCLSLFVPQQQQSQPTNQHFHLLEKKRQPMEAQGQPMEGQGQPMAAQRPPMLLMAAQGQPMEGQGQPMVAQGQPMEGQGQPMAAQRQPMEGQGQPMEARGKPMEAQGQPMEAQKN
ncbi:trace amine-associated receptor 1-like [Branchiostoma floridae]|uniref:Trace amine-associated receptor 1-like n=1 Tax=Branchiostoma floridae TaxID=7739 RepID=A0A9J7LBF1_BRAFL|nr:trace amine-associated receptor 1-like [Branchiostoma floridae]